MALVLRLVVNALAVWLAVRIVSGLSFDGSWVTLAIIAAILAAVNAIVKPVVKVLSLPLVVVTLGLFLLVINALMLQLTVIVSRAADLGLDSTGFFWATFLGAIVISIVTWVGEALTGLDS